MVKLPCGWVSYGRWSLGDPAPRTVEDESRGAAELAAGQAEAYEFSPALPPVDTTSLMELETSMKATEQLHRMGQSLWLDNITRGLLTSGTLERYIRELSVTGLTSNPSIFDHAIGKTGFYDDAIRGKTQS